MHNAAYLFDRASLRVKTTQNQKEKDPSYLKKKKPKQRRRKLRRTRNGDH